MLMVVVAVFSVDAAKEKAIKVKDKDMMRKMIIYDKVKRQLTKERIEIYLKSFSEKPKHVLLPGAE